jgi:glycosyltransferase involved in cell wall biosynthesis
VYHGLPEDLYRPKAAPGKYLAFLGRISPEKGVERAIEIARRVDMPIKIAGKIDAAERRYFETNIRTLFVHPLVEYVGEIGEREKGDFLGDAHALLFPEPFGLVMIEAFACGTPVIAYRLGCVPEIVDEAKTGFVVNSIDGAVKAIGQLSSMDRATCRRVFEERFSAARMASEYLQIYDRVLRHSALGTITDDDLTTVA